MAGLERVPVLFLTSRTTVSDVVRGLERGVHDYVRKPVDAGDVLARVSAALRTKRLEDGVTRVPTPAGALAQRPVTAVHRPASTTPVAPAGSVTGDCAVVLVDVDQVAHVSERYGPDAVEEVLGVVGRRLASRLRATDTAERWQSTQFLVVLPGTPLDGAMLVAERLRATISRTAIQISGVGLLDITVSCGVAVSTAGPTASVLRSADAALATAHAAGDNAVRCAA
jgi:two-component system cell cycle response regulator